MKRGKKAQFFIVAAIIISIIIISLFTINNRISFKDNPESFYDFTENFREEGYEIIDYAKFNKYSVENQLNNLTDIFTQYASSIGEDSEIAVITGNSTNINLNICNMSTSGSIAISANARTTQEIYTCTSRRTTDRTIVIEGVEYSAGEDYFRIIAVKKRGEERYVSK